MKEAIANEQIFLQLLFKKNEKMLSLLSEDEMLRDMNESLSQQVKELKDKIPDLDRDM